MISEIYVWIWIIECGKYISMYICKNRKEHRKWWRRMTVRNKFSGRGSAVAGGWLKGRVEEVKKSN